MYKLIIKGPMYHFFVVFVSPVQQLLKIRALILAILCGGKQTKTRVCAFKINLAQFEKDKQSLTQSILHPCLHSSPNVKSYRGTQKLSIHALFKNSLKQQG